MRAGGFLFVVSFTALAMSSAGLRAGETVVYTYDELGRLVKTTQSGTVNDGVETDVAYDPAGNRTDYDVSNSGGTADPNDTGATSGGIAGSGGGGETPPSFAVSDASATEGGSLTFTITKTGTVTNSYSVNYATADDTALAVGDYTAVSGTLTFTGAETSKMMTVATINDAASEPSEVFKFDLSAPTGGATITDSQGDGTITDDDGSSNNPPVTQGDFLTMNVCAITSINVTGNDTDPEGNYPLALVSENHNLATIVSSNAIRFNAPPFPGNHVVTYVVADSLGATSTGVLNVTVSGGTCF